MTPDQGRALARDLAAGRLVSDRRFEQLYPPEVRAHSKIHFTPAAVGRRVRDWLGTEPGLRVLDVGSGCGKFCLLFAASGPGKVTGIEQRPNLHASAEAAAGLLGVRNATFLCGRMEDLDWTGFNTFYFFNPFYERIAHRRGIDDLTPPHAGLYFDLVRTAREKLSAVKAGSRVLTYHGMGGRLGPEWTLIRTEVIHTDELQLWVKG